MQPYFFPYLGHFALIAHTDRWVVLDVTQYTPQSWVNRNRILHPNKGWWYATVPIDKTSMSAKIHDVRISDAGAARKRILGQLDHYRKKAPYFSAVRELVESTFAEAKGASLVDLNICGLKNVCAYLDLPFDYVVCSKELTKIPPVKHPGGWAVEISSILGATDYLNPVGGRQIFVPEEFRERGIELHFLPPPRLIYDCSPYEFIEHLSILDVLMWKDVATVRNALFSGTSPETAE